VSPAHKASNVELSAGLEPYKNVDILSPKATPLVGRIVFLYRVIW